MWFDDQPSVSTLVDEAASRAQNLACSVSRLALSCVYDFDTDPTCSSLWLTFYRARYLLNHPFLCVQPNRDSGYSSGAAKNAPIPTCFSCLGLWHVDPTHSLIVPAQVESIQMIVNQVGLRSSMTTTQTAIFWSGSGPSMVGFAILVKTFRVRLVGDMLD